MNSGGSFKVIFLFMQLIKFPKNNLSPMHDLTRLCCTSLRASTRTSPRTSLRTFMTTLFCMVFFWSAIAVAADHKALSFRAAELQISQLTIMPTRPGQPNGAAFLSIANQGKTADQLISFSIEPQIAKRGELHTMKHENGLMTMREVPGFALTPGKTMALKPGGDHLMLIGIQKPLEVGQKISATLIFEKAGKVDVIFTVEPPPAPMGGHRHH